MTLRSIISDAVASGETSNVASMARAAGYDGFDTEVLGEALLHYADNAPMGEADLLAPTVTTYHQESVADLPSEGLSGDKADYDPVVDRIDQPEFDESTDETTDGSGDGSVTSGDFDDDYLDSDRDLTVAEAESGDGGSDAVVEDIAVEDIAVEDIAVEDTAVQDIDFEVNSDRNNTDIDGLGKSSEVAEEATGEFDIDFEVAEDADVAKSQDPTPIWDSEDVGTFGSGIDQSDLREQHVGPTIEEASPAEGVISEDFDDEVSRSDLDRDLTTDDPDPDDQPDFVVDSHSDQDTNSDHGTDPEHGPDPYDTGVDADIDFG